MKHAKAIRILLIALLGLMPSTMLAAKKKRAPAGRTSAKAAVRHVRGAKVVKHARGAKSAKAAKRSSHKRRLAASAHNPRRHGARKKSRRVHRWIETWDEPDFADSTSSDFIDGEDLVVRRAAVEALGPYNGSIVVADPNNGRILTMVNQPLALKSGFQPCSTIKIVAALAGLSEGAIDRSTQMTFGRRYSLGLTEALAKSNNPYFARIGETLGYGRVTHYAKQFGLGEKAGLNIPGEQPGVLPSGVPPGGMGMMTSFGDGITLTPLQLTALMSVIANEGTLYYLQYPRSQEEAANFTPRVKRRLNISRWIPDIRPGMLGAVEYGTARRVAWGEQEEVVLGKTGTCTDRRSPTHLGWFGSYNDVGKKLVVVVLLTGGRAVNGPVASGIAGQVYRNLSRVNYFEKERSATPVALISTGNCCTGAAGVE